MPGFGTGGGSVKLGARAGIGRDVDDVDEEDGGWMTLDDEEDDEAGTCWKARVTSCSDIRDGPLDVIAGGVSPSSDLTSCRVNGTEVRSSAIPSREFTTGSSAFVEVCDQRSLRCSGSGGRAGESFIEKAPGDFDHEAEPGC